MSIRVAGIAPPVERQLYHRRLGGEGTFENFAAVTSRGTLVIKGDDGPNAIAVVRDNNLIKYTVRRGVGQPAKPEGAAFTVVIHASKVKRVLVEAGGGDDDELAKRATVYGGGGSDNLEGNHGATLVGGGGNDRLSVPPFDIAGWAKSGIFVDSTVVSPPPALLLGGDGNDVLVASALDSVVGGRGDDTAVEIYDIAPKAIEQLDAEADFGPQQASGIETFDVLVLKQVFGM